MLFVKTLIENLISVLLFIHVCFFFLFFLILLKSKLYHCISECFQLDLLYIDVTITLLSLLFHQVSNFYYF